MSWYSYLYIIFLYLSVVQCFINDNNEKLLYNKEVNEAKKKDDKDSYLTIFTMIFGALLLKAILIPLALKALAIMASISVLMSTSSFVISALLGYVKLALRPKDYKYKNHYDDPYYASSSNHYNYQHANNTPQPTQQNEQYLTPQQQQYLTQQQQQYLIQKQQYLNNYQQQ